MSVPDYQTIMLPLLMNKNKKQGKQRNKGARYDLRGQAAMKVKV